MDDVDLEGFCTANKTDNRASSLQNRSKPLPAMLQTGLKIWNIQGASKTKRQAQTADQKMGR